MSIVAGMAVSDAVREIGACLAHAGIETSRLDGRLLVEAATCCTQERLILEPSRPLTEAESVRLRDMVLRRLEREPVTRILGERYFYGRRFMVTPDTLDPRPETEALVDLALAIAVEEGWRDRPIEILDIGTGTGCILLTLLAEMVHARGLGTDLSVPAREVAKQNGELLGLAARVRWLTARSLDGVSGRFDLVVSNPPYIPSGEIAGLDMDVRHYDPLLALDGGADGLDMYREIVSGSARGEGASGKWFVVEVGAGQATAVLALVERYCGVMVASRHRTAVDLGGHTRCVAWKPRI
jgi:release factor glutamine methyltransferase